MTRPIAKHLISWVAIFFMFLLYIAAGHVRSVEGSSGLLAAQTDAYLAGQTHLLYAPPPALVQKSPPFVLDSCKKKSEFSDFDDHIVFNEKFYLPYGPVPTLLLFVPYKYLFGTELSLGFVSALFACIGTAFLLVSYVRLYRMLNLPAELFPRDTAYLLIAGTFIPFVLTVAGHYRVFLMAAYAFSALGLWCMLKANEQKNLRMECRRLAFCGLCFGLAAGCRFNFVLIGAGLGLYGIFLLREQKSNFYKAASLLLPWALCVLGLLYYNQLRFGSFFESGEIYQVTCRITQRTLGPLSWHFVPNNLYFYLLHPLIPDFSSFPVFNPVPPPDAKPFSAPWQSSFDFTTQEPVYGLINLPFLFFSVASIALIRNQNLPVKVRWMVAFLWIIPLSVLPPILLKSPTLRYVVDFIPWLMLSACLGYGWLQARYQSQRSRLLFLRVLGFVLGVYSICVNLL